MTDPTSPALPRVPAPILVLDIGRSRCRITDADRRATVVVDSGVSLSDRGGVERLGTLVDRAVRAWSVAAQAPPPSSLHGLGVATTGGMQTPGAARALADRLAAAWPTADVLVTGDVVAAHAGALAGRPGVVAIAGTGAVALGMRGDGTSVVVDGHGPWLGDDGSGHAVGRAGLRAALRHHDGRPGGSGVLAAAAREAFGPLDQLAATIHVSATPARDVAAFAPAVAAAARGGDPVADATWDDAAAALARTVTTAVDAVSATVLGLRGTLFDLDDLVTDRMLAAVADTHPALDVVSAAGDALDGVLALLDTTDAIHEPLVVRAIPTTTGAPVPAAASPHARGEAP